MLDKYEMINQFKFIRYILVILLLASCSEKKAKELPKAPVVEATPQAVAPVEAPKEKPIYVYSGDRFRDPFIPAGQSTNYQPDAVFDPQRATVRGIIFGKEYRSAVLTIGGSGTYFIKDGKIFDVMGKGVEGFTAKIFVDKVILTSEADNVFELKIKANDEEAKAL
ncbi:MAG: hypothetical protein KCHDKBKB_00584 [Elusimicrobia bacterium]|nr:hypothetical protein [Elusimicrobiota bacterium]